MMKLYSKALLYNTLNFFLNELSFIWDYKEIGDYYRYLVKLLGEQSPYPQVQPPMDWKYSRKKKIPESSKKQNLNLHTIYIVFTIIYIAFTLY